MKTISGVLGLEPRGNSVLISLPQPRLVRLVTRSMMVMMTIVSFPFLNASANIEARQAKNGIILPELLTDLSSRGLLLTGSRAVFVGNPGAELQLLVQSGIHPVSMISDETVDFVLADGFHGQSFHFIDRALKVNGVAAVRLGSDPAEMFGIPASYRMVYARLFGQTLVVALKKVTDNNGAIDNPNTWGTRKLLAVPDAKKAALNRLEEVALEPPSKGKRHRHTHYLPDIMGDSLDGYPRRVFVDVGSPGRAGSSGWFERHYPTRHRDFEIIRVDVVAEAAAGDGGMTEWLGKNVKEEEYVVVKAEAEVVEEMVKGRSLKLVDELFLECSNQWQKGKGVKSRRAYWECLALYGKLRDEGVAVHQWWG